MYNVYEFGQKYPYLNGSQNLKCSGPVLNDLDKSYEVVNNIFNIMFWRLNVAYFSAAKHELLTMLAEMW